MNRGLAISTVLLLMAAIWLPLAGGQEAPDHEFTPQLGDDLAAYGRGYLENLMLWSGAGIHLSWGPSFGGNASDLDDRLTQLEAAAGGSMPGMSAPLVVPFAEADPAFAQEAPIDVKENWTWATAGIEPRVGLPSVAATIGAETQLAGSLLEDSLDAEGLLMVLSALEAARFMDQHLGWNGSALGPVNMSDPNMTDTNASNGWWLPATQVMGSVNGSNGAWEDTSVETGATLEASMMALNGLLSLGDLLSSSDLLVGAGKPFPAGTDAEVLSLANAVYSNVIAVYYQEHIDLFVEDQEATVEDMAWSYMAMVRYSRVDDMVEYNRGWAEARAVRSADLLVQLQGEDGTLPLGVTTAVGGIPEGYIPAYLPMPGVAGHGAHSLATAVLYDASDHFGGMAYAAAARACFAADDANYFDDGHHIYVADKLAETPRALAVDQVVAFHALEAAVALGDLDLARYRMAQTWGGIVMTGLQLSETDANGEYYTVPEPDTNNNTIWKHDRDNGLGNPHGVAPVLAVSSTFDVGTKNWTVDDGGLVDTSVLMMAANVLMGLDGDWFSDAGAPVVSGTDAYRLVHWTPDEWKQHTDDLEEQVTNLSEQVDELQEIIDNGTGQVSELMATIASLEENLTAMEEDWNESLENETILRGQVDWLREKLEETNETVDDLEHQIVVLESQVERLETSVGEKDENLTKLQDQLRAEQNNVTQLQWQLDNASAALDQAEKDLAASQRDLKDTEDELDGQRGRQALVAVAALVAGMLIVVVILKLIGKL